MGSVVHPDEFKTKGALKVPEGLTILGSIYTPFGIMISTNKGWMMMAGDKLVKVLNVYFDCIDPDGDPLPIFRDNITPMDMDKYE